MQNTHVTVDGGEQWLSWAYSRARAMRSLGLPYMTKRYEMGDGSSVVVRLAQEMTYIELKQVKGGYLCQPRSVLNSGGVVWAPSGQAVTPDAVVKRIKKVDDPGLPEVDFDLKENTTIEAGGLDWKSSDDKRVVSWGYPSTGRYERYLALPFIHENGKTTNVGRPIMGLAPITRNSDGAKGYIYVHTASSRTSPLVNGKVEFYFYVNGNSEKIGEWDVPATGVNFYDHTVPAWWFFNSGVTQAVSVMYEEYVGGIGLAGEYDRGTMILADVVNPPVGQLSVTVRLEGGVVGGSVDNGSTPGSSSGTANHGPHYRPVYNPDAGQPGVEWVIIGWEAFDPGPIGYGQYIDHNNTTTIDSGQGKTTQTSVMGAEYVDDVPTLITWQKKLEGDTSPTGTEFGTDVKVHTFSGPLVGYAHTVTSDRTYQYAVDFSVLAGAKQLYNVKSNIRRSNSAQTATTAPPGGASTETMTQNTSFATRTVIVVLTHLDARIDLVSGMEFVAEGSKSGGETTAPTWPGKLTAFARFKTLEWRKDVGTADLPPSSASITGYVRFYSGGGGAGSRKKDEALATANPMRADGWYELRNQTYTAPGFVVAFKDDKRRDRADKFSIGAEPAFNAETITIF